MLRGGETRLKSRQFLQSVLIRNIIIVISSRYKSIHIHVTGHTSYSTDIKGQRTSEYRYALRLLLPCRRRQQLVRLPWGPQPFRDERRELP